MWTVEKAFAWVPLLATLSMTVDFPPNLQVLDVVDHVVPDGRAVTDGWMEIGVAAAEEPRQYSQHFKKIQEVEKLIVRKYMLIFHHFLATVWDHAAAFA